MKYIFIIISLSIGFCNIAFTQNENGILRNEWSVNINFFVNDLIFSKSSNENENIINYQAPVESIVAYRRYLNEKFVWQVGVNFYSIKDEEDFVLGLGGNQSQYKKGYYLRTGFQKYNHLSTKVKFYFGTDLILSFQKYKAIIDFEDVPTFFEGNYSHINREKEMGLVPHLGFRWNLNSRISFSTETSLIASYEFFDIDLDSPFSTEPILIGNSNTSTKDSEKLTFRFQQPIVLFFNLRF
jgi:hypothetical protein